jgi:hypothetical protein
LQLEFADNDWGSSINFQLGIPVELGGTLELTFSDDVDVATQVGRTLHLFDWTGVSPMGEFAVTAAHAWDLSQLYSTGEATLIAVPGDFDGDNQLSAADIDALALSIRAADPDLNHDLGGDGAVDLSDHTYWVHSLMHTVLGDANLDSVFDSSDVVAVFAAGQYEDDMDDNSGWATGDWNADGDFTSSDLIVALADGGYEQGPRPAIAAVPEPTSLALLFVGSFVIWRRTGRLSRYFPDCVSTPVRVCRSGIASTTPIARTGSGLIVLLIPDWWVHGTFL